MGRLVPVLLDIGAFVLQENYLPGIMATHFSVGVLDDAVLVISGKQLQTTLLDNLHLKENTNNV